MAGPTWRHPESGLHDTVCNSPRQDVREVFTELREYKDLLWLMTAETLSSATARPCSDSHGRSAVPYR
jgi:hypothetical protein